MWGRQAKRRFSRTFCGFSDPAASSPRNLCPIAKFYWQAAKFGWLRQAFRHVAEAPDRAVKMAALGRSFAMNGIIYLVGLVVVVLAVASFFGFR
jgi:hypothetical protein